AERARDGSSRVAFDRGGSGFAAFNASGQAWDLDAATALPDGTYDNAAGGGSVTVAGGRVTARVPADGAVALHVGGECDDPDGCGGADPGEPGGTLTATVDTRPGQVVRVVGETPGLGSWNPADGVALADGGDGTWSGAVALEADTEWKLVKVDGGGGVEWEPGGNRVGPAAAVTWGTR
ncbi:carbohydrate-binding module family 20 domain-containing protein, partial [Nocardiopsis tropica]|uniref:carbohydrate-binding module family 20 domain-containing protein n=1 Tax=Nocardiopsis tropica TaxID=109330 RepID=UPI0031D4FBFA